MNTRQTIRRVLIYRLGSLGDTVVALPSYHLIARAFPAAERRLLTNIPVHAKAPAAAAILGNSGLVHEYMNYPVGMRNLGQIARLIAQVRVFRPQVLVYLADLRGSRAIRRDALFFRLCGVRKIIGLPACRDDFDRRRLPDSNDFEWESARLAHSIEALGTVDLDDSANWNMLLTEAEHKKADAALAEFNGAPLLAVSVGTKVQSKDWGDANWTALLTRLADACKDHRIVLIGSPEEAEVSSRAAAAWGDRALNLCGRMDPRESAALLMRAELFLGHDSGPMHLAAAVGVPCVAIFAARNIPRVWFPYGHGHEVLYHQTDCAGCELEICIEEKKKCILSITVDEVMSAAMRQLDSLRRQREKHASANDRPL